MTDFDTEALKGLLFMLVVLGGGALLGLALNALVR